MQKQIKINNYSVELKLLLLIAWSFWHNCVVSRLVVGLASSKAPATKPILEILYFKL